MSDAEELILDSNHEKVLPVMYSEIVPLTFEVHGDYLYKKSDLVPHLRDQAILPVLTVEMIDVHRSCPIVFSDDENPVPIVIMGPIGGKNVFVDDKGEPKKGFYVPAYARRYPFIYYRADDNSEKNLLCFDGSAHNLGIFSEGERLFEDGKPSDATQKILMFCDEFERAARHTKEVVAELQKQDLLISANLSVTFDGGLSRSNYDGFKIVDESKLATLSHETMVKFINAGIFALIYAHLMSLRNIDLVMGADEKNR